MDGDDFCFDLFFFLATGGRPTRRERKRKKKEDERGKRTYKAEEKREIGRAKRFDVYRTTGDVKIVMSPSLGSRQQGEVIDGRAAPLFTGGKGQPF